MGRFGWFKVQSSKFKVYSNQIKHKQHSTRHNSKIIQNDRFGTPVKHSLWTGPLYTIGYTVYIWQGVTYLQ